MKQAAADTPTAEEARVRYLHEMLAPERLTVIVDIGANPINPAPYDVLIDAGLAKLYGFEPQQSAYDELVKHPKANRTYLPYAIGDGKPGILYECAHSGFTSLLKPNPEIVSLLGRWGDHLTVIDEIEVETRRLDDVAEIPTVDLLKIDVQGGELAVFENGHQALANAVAVMSEIAALPIYQDQPLMHDQMRELHELGFFLHKFDFFKDMHLTNTLTPRLKPRKHSNQLVDGDAIFMRSLMRLDKLEIEEAKHLALLADAVFHSHDLVLKVIDTLVEKGAISDPTLIDGYVDQLPFARKRRKAPAAPADNSLDLTAIIIAYNNASHIEEALLSAVKQSPPFREIVVVDDCSADATTQIIDGFTKQHGRIKSLRHEANAGAGAARNTGLEEAKSTYFCFLDGDDHFFDDMTASVGKVLNENQPADMLVFEGLSFTSSGKSRSTGGVSSGVYEAFDEKTPVFKAVTFPWNKIYRTSWINAEDIRFDAGKYEDIPWCYECILKANRIVSCPLPIVHYRIHDASALQSRDKQQLDVLDQWKKTLGLIKEYPEGTGAFLRFTELNAFIQMSRMLFSNRIPKKSEGEFVERMLELIGPLDKVRADLCDHPNAKLGLANLQRFEERIVSA